jgi:hypothetical protein
VDDTIEQSLPAILSLPPRVIPLSQPSFVWGDLDSYSFMQSVRAAYSEVHHWKMKLFAVPYGRVGKRFVAELSRLFRAYAESSELEEIALTAASIMPVLLLQNPAPSSKPKDHSRYLERRLDLWDKGDINSLVIEGRAIQFRLPKSYHSKRHQDSLARRF